MVSRLKIRQLEAFRAVMLSGTTTRAGAALGVAQSAVSRLICDLEEELGTPLFVRGHGRLSPTEEADWLFNEAQDLLSRLDKLDTAARDIRHLAISEVRIIATPPLAYGLIPECIRRMRQAYPKLSATLQITFRREVRMWTDAQNFDLALTTLPIDYPKAHTEHLVRVDGVCILPPRHPLLKKEAICAAELADAPLILPLPETLSRFRLDRLFEELGVRRTGLTIESHTALTMCQMVAAGLGLAVVDPFTANAFAQIGIEIRPFVPGFSFEYATLYPARRPPSRLARALAQTIRDVLRENPLYAEGMETAGSIA